MHDKLWYDRYVKDWMHALPLGNGRIGALVFGDPDREIIGINEESLWSGTTAPEKYATTPEDLTKLRQLIAEERLKEASELFAQAFTSDPLRIRHYETFGRIYVDFSDKTPYTDYYKELDLQRGVASVSWKKEDASFQSESFVSEDRDVFVYRVSSDKPFSCKVRMDRAQDAYSAALSSDTLILNGRITYCDNPLHGKGAEGMSFGGKLKLLTDGESTPEHSALSVKDATFVLLYSTFATNYDVSTFTIDETKDYRKTLSDRLNGLTLADYDKMYEDHCRDHEKSFSAVRLHLDGEDRSNLPT
ncbi:MAG: glycoside hydrolase family 95 protein, partial [Clostridia bacterium]|nr:glycoside hydrolase family 95 protein [Clostridia bacterium]